jgi:hypothetical protein
MNGTCTFWCLLLDKYSKPFPIKVPVATSNGNIFTLQELIKEQREHGALNNTDAADLVLWKVRFFQVSTQP